MVTVFVSIIATLAFESPIIVIEKLIFSPKDQSESKAENEQREKQQNQSEIQDEPIENDTNSILSSPTISDDTGEVLAALNSPYRGLIIKILKKLKQSGL